MYPAKFPAPPDTRASLQAMQGDETEDVSPMPAWRPASRLVPNHSVAARVRQMRADQHGTSLSSSELSATPDMFASHHGSVSSHSGPPSRPGTLSTAMERVIRVERKRAGKVRATGLAEPVCDKWEYAFLWGGSIPAAMQEAGACAPAVLVYVLCADLLSR